MPAALAALVSGHAPLALEPDGPPLRPTSFACGLRRDQQGLDGFPCKGTEEQSCNEVHATCASAPLQGFQPDDKDPKRFLKPLPPCEAPPPGKRGKAAARGAAAAGLSPAKAALKTAGSLLGQGRLASAIASKISADHAGGECNARMLDMPYGLRNPQADPDGRKGGLLKKALNFFSSKGPLPVNQEALSMTVWGLAVHGLSGTFAFDGRGARAADYVYELNQGPGLPPDFYLCDSRMRPQVCALLGGNMRRACAEYYDPQQCDFCEDHGSSLVCAIRGWSPKNGKWAKVPIYPRDLLGELYRGEWRDVFARPMWASVTLPKASFESTKQMPAYMVGPGPAAPAMQRRKLAKTPSRFNILASMSPLFAPPEPLRVPRQQQRCRGAAGVDGFL